VHAPADEEEGQARVEEAVVEWVCNAMLVKREDFGRLGVLPRSMAFGQRRMNSYILLRSSAGKSKKRNRSAGAGDEAREVARDGAREGYLDETAEETALVAVDE
jgi:hypothetical protein